MQVISSYQQDVNIPRTPLGPESPESVKESKESESPESVKESKESKESKSPKSSELAVESKSSELAKGSESLKSVEEPKESVESKGRRRGTRSPRAPGLKMKNPGFTRARAFAARYRPGPAGSLVAGIHATGGHRLRTNHRVP